MALSVTFTLLIAILLNQRVRGLSFFRMIFFSLRGSSPAFSSSLRFSITCSGARMMTSQYRWLYERTGLFSWREKASATKG